MFQLSLQQCEIPHPFVEISYHEQFTVIKYIFYFRILVADHMPPLKYCTWAASWGLHDRGLAHVIPTPI
jgi:hypothetical protein